jgi:hypothetical protein
MFICWQLHGVVLLTGYASSSPVAASEGGGVFGEFGREGDPEE